jgi:LysM repeat protein
VVTNGRSDLRGPLCQIYQSREPDGNDVIFVVASGVANHGGEGEWNGVSGNSKSLGLEIEWSGPKEAFPARRKAICEQAMAALMQCALGTNPDDACEHREYAKPAGRKIDTNLGGDELRARMRQLLGQPKAGPASGASPAAGGGKKPAPSAKQHIVRSGDTLGKIAAQNGMTLKRLLELNPKFAPDPALIHPGDVVRLE